ncbi:MAG: hypothetical protein AB7Y46_02175 [Armatimonadota bacterium]
MERRELIEWVVIIAGILAWWPRIFMGYDAGWYNALIYAVYPIVLIAILVTRWRRVHEGFEYSRKIVDAQHQASGRNILGPQPQSGGPQSPYPGVVLPDQHQMPDLKLEDEDEK